MNRCMSILRAKTDVPLPLMSNILPTIHFSRMLAPYTIFPIPGELRFEIMTGEFFIYSLLNISGLERWLRNRGWRTTYVSPPDTIVRGNEPTHLPVLRVFKANSRKVAEIGLDTMALAAMELWMPESLERIIEAIIDQGMSDGAYTVNFPNIGKYAWD